MKKIVMLVILLGIIFLAYTLWNKEDFADIGLNTVMEAPTAAPPTPVIEQGSITVVNTDAASQLPIEGTVYTIIDAESAAVIETMTTDASGRATSSLLDYGITYTIKQQEVVLPYERSEEEHRVVMNAPSRELATTNHLLAHVKEAVRTEDGHIAIKKVYIDVDTLMQKPELPNGCEITSLTAVLHYYGYETTKTEMADVYLPKQAFSLKEGKLYGPDPYKAYAGDPRQLKGAFFSFAPPIVEAAQLYFDAVGRSSRTADISGSTREQILEQLNAGIPVITWITLDLTKPKMDYGWHYNDTGDYHAAPVNLHVVVLNGYENNKVHVMNPLEGQVIYDADAFFNSYAEMGSHAMIVGS